MATVQGVELGVQRPIVLLAIPVLAVVVGLLVLRPREDSSLSRRRLALFGSRLLVVSLLVLAAAGPYSATTREAVGDPTVRLLVDRSDSTAVQSNVSGRLATAIEERGVPVETTVVASGANSPLGDRIASALRPNGTVVVVSDGRVTDGRSMAAVAELAQQVNATISVVNGTTTTTERFVTVNGPRKTSVGVENTYLVRVGGVRLDEGNASLSVTVDGEEVHAESVRNRTAVEVSHTFNETGSHRITATVDGDDRFDRNDVYRSTVRVVPQPSVLYVAQGDYPLGGYLDRLYDVERARTIPDDLSPYYAVVVQDRPASSLGNVTALQRAVVDGTGLVVVGGPNAYDEGGYRNATIGTVLPVTQGEPSDAATVVLAVDVSGSSQKGMRVQKALALDVLDQLGDQNRVGLVAFNTRAYGVTDPEPLRESRDTLEDRIKRLESSGGTHIATGLRGSGTMLGDGGGTVILISDGRDHGGGVPAAAAELANQGTRVIAVGVGVNVDESHLQRIGSATGGSYLRADQTNRLRILFGGPNREYSGNRLTVVEGDHFVTHGVELTANPGQAHDVRVKERADYLVATGSGRPAIAAWHYGLGRAVSITTYGPDGTLDGLLDAPDSLVVTKSVNWAIGDPERLATGVTDVPDTRVGEPTTVVYEGGERPTAEGVQFVRDGDSRFRATVVASEQDYHTVLDASYAANYPREYGAFGQASALRTAAVTTGGQVFEPDQAAAIAEFARERSRRVREVTTDWTWLPLAAGLLVYLLEVSVRRVRDLYGDPP
ncbi:vWA domain-containing protein [Haloarculaceae archaeon H-GB11]|nr:vWA domain-containing protein [Haloarculaceae archaeon H-GB11]